MAGDPRVVLDVSGLDRLLRDEPGKVETWLDGEAEETVTDIVLSFGTSPAGLEYKRGTVVHVASVAGYPPNPDTASLMLSIHWEKTARLERTIMDGVEHGLLMEDGTEAIMPRPWMRPAFERLRKRIERSAQQNLGLEK